MLWRAASAYRGVSAILAVGGYLYANCMQRLNWICK
jgi:hypothetical protein